MPGKETNFKTVKTENDHALMVESQAQISEARVRPYISGSHFRISFPDQIPAAKGEIAFIEDRSTNGEV
jgi:hypothetical protein